MAEGCERPAVCKGYCGAHWARVKRFGEPRTDVPVGTGAHFTLQPKPDPAVLFWTKVEKRGDGCWEWQGARTRFGHGRMRIDGKEVGAHRFSFALHNPDAEIDGAVVRHSCDNPPCVNPNHLLLGTMGDNNRDASRRGRSSTKLTETDVLAIRARHASGESYSLLGREFGVSAPAVRAVVLRRVWTHV